MIKALNFVEYIGSGPRVGTFTHIAETSIGNYVIEKPEVKDEDASFFWSFVGKGIRSQDSFDTADDAMDAANRYHHQVVNEQFDGNVDELVNQIEELTSDLAEADLRAGTAERRLARFEKSTQQTDMAIFAMKDQWGAPIGMSFDEVWKEALECRAKLWKLQDEIAVNSSK